jgi:hypothetical protein
MDLSSLLSGHGTTDLHLTREALLMLESATAIVGIVALEDPGVVNFIVNYASQVWASATSI